MKFSFRKIILSILAIYVGVSCYTAYLLVVKRLNNVNNDIDSDSISQERDASDEKWNPWGLELEGALDVREPIDWQRDFGMRDIQEQDKQQAGQSNEDVHVVEIWGKAAIGLYLWEHIMEGKMEAKMGGVWNYGTKQIGNVFYRFRTGPGVVPAKVPPHVENLVLILNGREESKVDFSRMWLDYLPNFRKLKNVALVLLGNEQCDNDWVKAYMAPRGGIVDFVFVVYDSPDVDEKLFYQWPLGVATYRNFPLVNSSTLPVEDFRPFRCNFLGTVYKNSSREELLRVLRDYSLTQTCYINPRLHWVPSETGSSLDEYTRALSNSDLTLNPVGQNSECYRVYESMSYGSVPVIEDVHTPGSCSQQPLRLIKQYNAPFIYVKQWKQLPDILKKEEALTLEDLVQRRKQVMNWYKGFKTKMRDKFTTVISERFFSEE